MKDLIFDDFQSIVSDSNFSNKNPWDALIKIDECQYKINRALINTIKNENKHMNSLLLDNENRERVEEILGDYMFNLTLLCDCLNISLFDVIIKEYKLIQILGKYNLK